MAKKLYIGLAVVCLCYYIWLGMNNGFGLSVLSFWLMLSALFFMCYFNRKFHWDKKLPKLAYSIFRIVSWIIIILFLTIESCVAWNCFREADENLDYLIVLGAALSGEEPSAVLEKRLEKAYEYLQTHPETQVVVSGGQGETELISEAESMKNWLIRNGIEDSRILVENKSTTIAENIKYSFRLMEGNSHNKVGIVTSNFHVFRAVCIAKKVSAVYENAEYELCGVPADFSYLLMPHYMVREFFTIVVDALRGNMEF